MTGSPNSEAPRMANLLYKDHLITVVARTDEISTFWIPMVDISWDTDGQRKSHTITDGDWFNTWQDSERQMIKLAKAWIDSRVTNYLQLVSPQTPK